MENKNSMLYGFLVDNYNKSKVRVVPFDVQYLKIYFGFELKNSKI